MKNIKYQIGIIGYAGYEEYPAATKINKKVYEYAYELGKFVGNQGWNVVTGGKSGIMEEANRGCQETGGISIGVVTGNKRFTGNKFLDVEVVSGMYNCGEEMTLVSMCDIVIVLGGGVGTLQELAIAYRMGKPVLSIKGLGGWSGKLEKVKFMDERKQAKIDYFEHLDDLKKHIGSVLTSYQENC